MTTVTLTWDELATAWDVALRRHLKIRREDRQQPRFNQPAHERLRRDLESCPTELAVAKLLGLYWPPTTCYDPAAADVGRDVEVRTTTRPDGCLIMHPDDKDHRRYFLVIPRGDADPRTFDVIGWLWGSEAKAQPYWRTQGVPHPAYFVPQSHLRHSSDQP